MLKIQQNYFYYAYGIDFLYCLCYNINSFERNKKQKLKNTVLYIPPSTLVN